ADAARHWPGASAPAGSRFVHKAPIPHVDAYQLARSIRRIAWRFGEDALHDGSKFVVCFALTALEIRTPCFEFRSLVLSQRVRFRKRDPEVVTFWRHVPRNLAVAVLKSEAKLLNKMIRQFERSKVFREALGCCSKF